MKRKRRRYIKGKQIFRKAYSFTPEAQKISNTFVLGYHKYIKNANLASLYIGTLQERRKNTITILKEIYRRMEIVSLFTLESYHEIKASPTLSQTVKTATKILQFKRGKITFLPLDIFHTDCWHK
jgi:hypothetical protein